jgi:hypothetical protein
MVKRKRKIDSTANKFLHWDYTPPHQHINIVLVLCKHDGSLPHSEQDAYAMLSKQLTNPIREGLHLVSNLNLSTSMWRWTIPQLQYKFKNQLENIKSDSFTFGNHEFYMTLDKTTRYLNLHKSLGNTGRVAATMAIFDQKTQTYVWSSHKEFEEGHSQWHKKKTLDTTATITHDDVAFEVIISVNEEKLMNKKPELFYLSRFGSIYPVFSSANLHKMRWTMPYHTNMTSFVSPRFTIFEREWFLEACFVGSDVRCQLEFIRDNAINAHFAISLINQNDITKTRIGKTKEYHFTESGANCCFDYLLSTDDGFIKNNMLIFELTITVDPIPYLFLPLKFPIELQNEYFYSGTFPIGVISHSFIEHLGDHSYKVLDLPNIQYYSMVQYNFLTSHAQQYFEVTIDELADNGILIVFLGALNEAPANGPFRYNCHNGVVKFISKDDTDFTQCTFARLQVGDVVGILIDKLHNTVRLFNNSKQINSEQVSEIVLHNFRSYVPTIACSKARFTVNMGQKPFIKHFSI